MSIKANRKTAIKEMEMKMSPKEQCLLFFLPFTGHLPILSLGPVSSSFLASRRRRRGQSGCLFAIDVNRQSPPGGSPGKKRLQFSPSLDQEKKVIPNTHQGCKRVARNSRVARAAVSLLSSDQSIDRVNPLPRRIQCGQLRSAIRDCFPAELTPVQQLSIKTAQKLEMEPCQSCASESDALLRQWKEARFKPARPVEGDHLERFIKALSCNVETGWNRSPYPYIPTGHATLWSTRGEGGSWAVEPFSSYCRPELVYSAGKPRVVTLYSAHNAEVLTPLHQSLYASLQRKGWLLVGSPTHVEVNSLNGGGSFVSVDYQSATDNIRADYCQAAIELLIRKAEGLSAEQIRCLRVVGELRIACPDKDSEDDVKGPPANHGQPMGSLISFPLLCLINKTIVDLAVADLASAGEISWEQFQKHRCLINGDDLLYREFFIVSPDRPASILPRLINHGRAVGLVVNGEKNDGRQPVGGDQLYRVSQSL